MSFLTPIRIEAALADEQALEERLAFGIAPKMLPVFADIHAEIVALAGPAARSGPARRHCDVLIQYAKTQIASIAELKEAERQFQNRSLRALDAAEQRAAILDFAHALGRTPAQRRSDRKALKRWFDADAVAERCHKRLGERERALAHAVERLGHVAADVLIADPLMLDASFIAELLDEIVSPMRAWRGDSRVRQAAYSSLATIANALERWPFGLFDRELSIVRRACLDDGEDVWVQCAAFDVLFAMSPRACGPVIAARTAQPISALTPKAADDALFLRRHLVRKTAAFLTREPGLRSSLLQLAGDANGAVRQMVASVLPLLPESDAERLAMTLRTDADPQVRAQLLADLGQIGHALCAASAVAHVEDRLRHDEDSFVLRVALHAAATLAMTLPQDETHAENLHARLRSAVRALQRRDLSPKLNRWADEAGERIWLTQSPSARAIAASVCRAIDQQREAEIRPLLACDAMLASSRETVGRVLAVLAQNDFGLSIKGGSKPSIQRGEWIKRRVWRILFEGRHSATDKRQAHLHTTGRHYHGTLIAPSGRMSELAPTKVPGEPLFEASEGGWRHYLPLVDQVLSAIDQGQPITLFTCAGMTDIAPPKGLVQRLRSFWRISARFAELSDLRNREPADFIAALRSHEVAIRFRRHDGCDPSPRIAQMFRAKST